jgi:hypothetical protein
MGLGPRPWAWGSRLGWTRLGTRLGWSRLGWTRLGLGRALRQRPLRQRLRLGRQGRKSSSRGSCEPSRVQRCGGVSLPESSPWRYIRGRLSRFGEETAQFRPPEARPAIGRAAPFRVRDDDAGVEEGAQPVL